jgi:hypothetical protein
MHEDSSDVRPSGAEVDVPCSVGSAITDWEAYHLLPLSHSEGEKVSGSVFRRQLNKLIKSIIGLCSK